MKNILKFCLVGFLCFATLPARATHIVGGEIQVRHTGDFNYDFLLHLYFDLINGTPDAKDQRIRLTIFSKVSKIPMDSVFLDIVFEQEVPYTNPECKADSVRLRTKYIRYLKNFKLSPNRYNNPNGYYVIWERCCRNNVINNIEIPPYTVSTNPVKIEKGVGMTFYTEIPLVAQGQNRTPFINSSPAFAIPKGDYLCVGRPFTMDFSATDADGDELSYSLVAPLAGNSRPFPDSLIIPKPKPALYAEVVWIPPHSTLTPILHDFSFPSHRFNIDKNTGILRVIPSQVGLCVFSVRCEEFRNGIKIGEVRRDFQFKILSCEVNNKPTLTLQTGTQGGQPTFYKEGDILTLTADNACLTAWGKDPENPENLSFKLVPLNFTLRANVFSPASGTTRGINDSLRSGFCWDKCLFSKKDQAGNWIPYDFYLIVGDDGCPANLMDSIRVKVLYLPTQNSEPTLVSDAPVDASGQYDYTLTKQVGQVFEFNVTGNDADNDLLELSMEGIGFNPAELGMQFESKSGKGNVQSKFYWSNGCAGVTQQDNEFILEFTLREQISCERREKKFRVKLLLIDKDVDLTTFLPPNAFSPNGDGYNQTFTMNNLPAENCRFKFERITIFNRWGGKAFESTDRNFKWDGGDFPASVYYYTVDFKGQQYKGTVSLLR